MVLFDYDKSLLVEGAFSFLQKLNCILVSEVRKHPLYPDAIVFLLKVKLLQPLRIEMTDILVLQYLLWFLDVFLTLIDHVHLHYHHTLLFYIRNITFI